MQKRPRVESSAESIIENYLVECRAKKLQLPPTQDMQVRVGSGNVMRDIFDLFCSVKNVTQKQLAVGQETVAAVLMAPSGIGKTFTAQTYPAVSSVDDSEKNAEWYVQYTREDDSRWQHLSLYLGFNTGCPSTRVERRYIKDADYSEAGFGVVVLGRLVGLLAAYIAAGFPMRDPSDGDVHKYIDEHKCDALLQDPSIPVDTMYTSLMKVAVDLLLSVPGVTGATTTVLINVDEAQLLDELVWGGQTRPSHNDKTGGAQHALKVLRNLQLKVMKSFGTEYVGHMCIPMALATGIQPAVSLQTATQGTNICVSGDLITREHFLEIASAYASRHNPCNMSEDQLKFIAGMLYPRVRPLLQAIEKPTVIKYPMVMAEDECLKILIRYLNNMPMLIQNFPAWCCYKNAGPDVGVPYLDPLAWFQLLITLGMCSPPFSAFMRTGEWRYHLEYGVRNVLHFIFDFFYRRRNDDNLNTALFNYRERGLEALNNIGFASDKYLDIRSQPMTLNNDATKYHPFEGHISHAHSCTQPISSEFRLQLRRLKKDGDVAISHCGSSAPIDILVTMRQSDELQMTYIDAKSHSTQPTTKHTEQMLIDARMIAEKALWVHGAFMRQLPNVLTTFYAAIVTNAALSSEDLARIEEESRCAVPIASAEEMRNVYLAPNVNHLSKEWQAPDALYLCQGTSAVKYFRVQLTNDGKARVHCYCVRIRGALEEASAIAAKLGVERGPLFLLPGAREEPSEDIPMYTGDVVVIPGVHVLCPSNFVVEPWTSILFQAIS